MQTINQANFKTVKQATEYTITRAEPRDEKTIIKLLEQYVTTQQAASRYKWIYKRNPQGEAATWIACEPHGQIVGFTSIFAREFLIGGNQVMGGVGFDAFVRPDHRRRGIALSLHAASLIDMKRGSVPFRFMCGPPVKENLDALIKAGSNVVGGIRYLGLPLTTGGLMTMLHYRKKGKISFPTSLSDYLLTGIHRIINGKNKEVSVRVTDRVDYHFDRLWEDISSHFSVIGRRDAAYLNWRYLENPVCWQQLVCLEKRGQLVGWAVLEFAPQGCLLVDYLLPIETKIAHAALSSLVAYVAEQGASRLTLRFNLKSKYTGLFLRHGFFPGWSVEHLQTLCSDPKLLPQLLDLSQWHFSNGDLNPESSPWSVNTSPQAEWASANYVCANWQENIQIERADNLLELQPSIEP